MEPWKKEGTLAYLTYQTVMEALIRTGSPTKTARELDIGRSTLHRWLNEWGIDDDRLAEIREVKEQDTPVLFRINLKPKEDYSVCAGSVKKLKYDIGKPRRRAMGEFAENGHINVIWINRPGFPISKEEQFSSTSISGFQFRHACADRILACV